MVNLKNVKLNFNLSSSVTDMLQANNVIIDNLTTELKNKIKNVGTNNTKYQDAENKIKNAIKENIPLEQVITQKIDILLLALLLSDSSYEIDLSDKLLSQIKSIRPQLTEIIITWFTEYFFKKFDLIPNYKNLSKWIVDIVKTRNEEDLLNDKPKMDFIDFKFLSPPHESINLLIATAIYNKLSLDDVIKNNGLHDYLMNGGRYMEKVQSEYYIYHLKKIPDNDNNKHSIIDEILETKVYKNLHTNSILLGVKIIEILISKAPYIDVNEQWQNAILEIAGDPRMGNRNKKYRQYWQNCDEHLRNKVIGWLSKLDLKLFLKALEDSTEDSEIVRMFHKRRIFLQGLLEDKRILRTRLYLSKNMDKLFKLNASVKNEQLPDYSIVSDVDKSIIHITLPNNIDVIEGTHNCYMSFYSNLSKKAIIFNYDKKNVNYRDLTKGLEERFKENFKSKTNHKGDWWNRSLETLEDLGVSVNPQEIMSPEDYRDHKRKNGVRTWR